MSRVFIISPRSPVVDSIDVRMNGERLEYGELYASEQSNVTFTVQVSNINTFNEINPVVKV